MRKTRIILMMAAVCVFVSMSYGRSGFALKFDGVDDYIHAPYIGAYQTMDFTYEAWINPGSDLSGATTGQVIIARGEDASTDNSNAYLMIYGTGMGLGVTYETNSDADKNYYTGYIPPKDIWTHVAATRTIDGKVNVYVNGVNMQLWTGTPNMSSNCYQQVSIGAALNNDGYIHPVHFFNGVIDEVRFWGIALSDSEIASNYNRTIDPSLSGLVGYWNFDEGEGITAHDLTGNSNAMLGLNGTGTDLPRWVIPEPATLLLLGLGAVMLRRKRAGG